VVVVALRGPCDRKLDPLGHDLDEVVGEPRKVGLDDVVAQVVGAALHLAREREAERAALLERGWGRGGERGGLLLLLLVRVAEGLLLVVLLLQHRAWRAAVSRDHCGGKGSKGSAGLINYFTYTTSPLQKLRRRHR